MSSTLTIRLDRKLQQMLNEAARETGTKRSELVREALRRHLTVQKFERLRRKTIPYARRAGFITDEDVYREIS